ncbi:hypothetical protein [Algibacter marinivivus]|nr:hypothetical protein [Algibacter marinivivus]
MIIIIVSCSSSEKKSEDISLLKVYIENYKDKQKKDSVFLGLDNTNSEVFKIIRKYNSKSEVIPDELKNVFTKKNYDYLKKQMTKENSVWELDFTNLDNVFSVKNYPHKNNLEVIYLSKPIYTVDGEYGLIQKLQKTDENVYFISSVEVYKRYDEIWKKISDISRY